MTPDRPRPNPGGRIPPASLLVIKPSSLGDVIHTLPAVGLLHRRWPDARVRWLVNPEWRPLLEGNPHIEAAIEFPRSGFRGAGGVPRAIRWILAARRSLRADLVVDFQGLLRSALIGRAARGDRLVGPSDSREGARWFYDTVVDVPTDTHSVRRYLALSARVTGLDAPDRPEFPLPVGTVPGGIPDEPFVVLHPVSRGRGKSLSPERTDGLARRIADRHPVVVVGRPAAPFPLPPHPRILDLMNRTSLADLIGLMRRARAVVSVDSGPMHVAAAVNPRVLGIHFWSDPARVGPFSPSALVWRDGGIRPALGVPVGGPARDQAAPMTDRDLDAIAAATLAWE